MKLPERLGVLPLPLKHIVGEKLLPGPVNREGAQVSTGEASVRRPIVFLFDQQIKQLQNDLGIVLGHGELADRFQSRDPLLQGRILFRHGSGQGRLHRCGLRPLDGQKQGKHEKKRSHRNTPPLGSPAADKAYPPDREKTDRWTGRCPFRLRGAREGTYTPPPRTPPDSPAGSAHPAPGQTRRSPSPPKRPPASSQRPRSPGPVQRHRHW